MTTALALFTISIQYVANCIHTGFSGQLRPLKTRKLEWFNFPQGAPDVWIIVYKWSCRCLSSRPIKRITRQRWNHMALLSAETWKYLDDIMLRNFRGATDSTALQQTKINDIYIAVWISRVVPLAGLIIAKRMSIHHAAKQFLKNEWCLISHRTVSTNPLQGWPIFIHRLPPLLHIYTLTATALMF